MEYNPYQIYKDYIFLKQHFKEWDFFWNENSSYKVSVETFKNRKDLFFFKKLYKEYYNRNDCVQHIISGFLHNKDNWIGDLFNEDITEYHYSRMKIFNHLELIFEQDCEKISDYLEDRRIAPETAFLTKGTGDCMILNIKNIHLETLTILQHFNPWVQYWFPLHPSKKERRFQIYKYHCHLSILTRYDKLKQSYNQLMQTRAKLIA